MTNIIPICFFVKADKIHATVRKSLVISSCSIWRAMTCQRQLS